MGVKYSQLPDAASVAANDQIAMLDVSGNILTKIPVNHAYGTTAFGLGDSTHYGHTKLSDTYDVVVGNASSGIGASQAALKAVYDYAKAAPDAPLTVVNGELCITYDDGTNAE